MSDFSSSEIPNSSDSINRKAAVDELIKMLWDCFQADEELVDAVVTTIKELPPAQPERKGKWIKLDMHAHLADHKCTACGQECYVPTCMGAPMYTYCPNCGCRMEGVE